MHTTIELNTDHLDGRLEESLKKLFPHQNICVVAYKAEPSNGTVDTTEDLLSDPKRRERLLQAIEDAKAGRNLVAPDQSIFT